MSIQSGSDGSIIDSCEIEFLPLGEFDRRRDDPAVYRPQQLVASRRAHELRGSRFLSLLVDHPQYRVVDLAGLAAEIRNAEMNQPKAVLDQRRFQLVNPERIEALDARALVRGFLEHGLVAAALSAALIRAFGVAYEIFDAIRPRAHLGDTDRAAQGQRLFGNLENLVGDA